MTRWRRDEGHRERDGSRSRACTSSRAAAPPRALTRHRVSSSGPPWGRRQAGSRSCRGERSATMIDRDSNRTPRRRHSRSHARSASSASRSDFSTPMASRRSMTASSRSATPLLGVEGQQAAPVVERDDGHAGQLLEDVGVHENRAPGDGAAASTRRAAAGLRSRRFACSASLTMAQAGSGCSDFSQASTSSGSVRVTSWAGRPYLGGRPRRERPAGISLTKIESRPIN